MPSVSRKPKADKGKMVVQSVLVPKKGFSKEKAKAWVSSHKFYTGGMDESSDYYRFRQYNPEHFSRMRTKAFPGGRGIKAVYGVVK